MMDPEVARQLASTTDSPLHGRLVDVCRRRLEASERRWSQRHDRYRESERLYRAFRTPDADDQVTRANKLTEGVEKIVVPYGYAVLQSMLAFMMTTLTQRQPLIPVAPKGPHDARGAILMEACLDAQCADMSPTMKLVVYQLLLDGFRYGAGIVKGLWTLEEWPELVRETRPNNDLFGNSMGVTDVTIERDVVSYEGNQFCNISPFDFFPDPRRNLCDFQRGEFVFHRIRRSMTELRQKQAQGLYVGVDRIPKLATQSGYGDGLGSSFQSDASRIMDMSSGDSDDTGTDEYGEPYVTLHEGYVYLDTNKIGLPGPESDVPRLWVMTFANRARIIRAEAANLPARRFPFEVFEPNYDWHSPANHSMIEVFRGLQYYYSWLFNSRMLAVRRTLNNEMIIDPGMVEELDLLDPEPGRLIRLTREHWGDGHVRDAVFPIPIQDTTAGHLQDAKVVQDLIQTVVGASNIIMGMPNPGRRAATEVQGQMKLAAGRMQMLLELFAEQTMKPMARGMAKNTQAFLDLSQPMMLREPYPSILGAPYVQLTPDMIAGDFLFPITDQGLPSDRMFEASVWKEFLMPLMQSGALPFSPQTIQAIAARFLRAMGIRDLQTFGLTTRQFTVEPDAQVQAQVQQGNLVPTQDGTSPVQYGGTSNPMPVDGFAAAGGNGVPGGGAMGHA